MMLRHLFYILALLLSVISLCVASAEIPGGGGDRVVPDTASETKVLHTEVQQTDHPPAGPTDPASHCPAVSDDGGTCLTTSAETSCTPNSSVSTDGQPCSPASAKVPDATQPQRLTTGDPGSGGHGSSSDSLSETGVRGAGIAPIVQPQQHPLPPTLPLQLLAPGATCTPNSSNLPCTTTPEELTPTKPVITTTEKPGHGAHVDAPSNKDGHRAAADRTGAHVTLVEAGPGIGSGSGTDDNSSSNHPTASPPPAASTPASDPQPGNSDNHVSSAADSQGSAGTQPSSSSTSSSETVSSGSSETTKTGNGTTSAENGSPNNTGDVGNADTTTTTTTLPPELTNNKKGDADSSSSISSSVWVRVPLLIVVTLACIL
ncbi:uncharacterized protein TM35_000451590, partial [Trypanosoma theileri]